MSIYTESAVILGLDGLSQNPPTPILTPTSGEGSPGYEKGNNDWVAVTSAAAANDFYRLCRFPWEAKVKHVWSYGKGIDTNATDAATFDVNVAFSDSISDGSPSSVLGFIPDNTLNGVSHGYTVGTGYLGTPNKMFGSAVKLNANEGAALWQDLVFSNTFTPAMSLIPLWENFGFVTATGLAQSPGGLADLLLMQVATGTTAAAGVINIEVDFVL
jgi:hypothetical protein